MPKIVVTAEVKDPVAWEKGFRTLGKLFRRQSVSKPIQFGTIAGNQIAVCFEPSDVNTFMNAMDSTATAEAMAFDGVKRETVKLFVLDKEFVL